MALFKKKKSLSVFNFTFYVYIRSDGLLFAMILLNIVLPGMIREVSPADVDSHAAIR